MKYLLDTDVVINHLHQKTRIDEEIILQGAAISIISYGELLYGAEKSNNKEKLLSNVYSFIKETDAEIINLDEKILSEFAKLKCNLEQKGKRLDNFDLLIAATALTQSLILVTKNIKHFSRIKELKLQ